LRPGVKNLSEKISVRSIVDRFLEHSRIFYFENGCQPEVFVGSADWMPRNFFRRIEVVFPVEDGGLRDRIINEILAITLSDNCRASILQPNGAYKPATQKRGVPLNRSQEMFIELVLDKSRPTRRRKKQKGYPEVKLSRKPA
jgi:polyphosphate kinase